MNVDVHAHAFGPKFREAAEALAQGSTSGMRAGGVRDRATPLDWFDPDHALRDMDAKKFDMRILSHGPDVNAFTPAQQVELSQRINDEMIALVRRHPDRLRVLVSLPFGDIEGSVKELDRMATAPEMVGVFMRSNIGGVSPADPKFEPIWAKIDELRLPVVEHPAYPVYSKEIRENNNAVIMGYMFETQLMIVRLIQAGIFEKYQNFPFVVAHTGAGVLDLLHRIDRACEHVAGVKEKLTKKASDYVKQFYFDTCTFYEPPLMMAHKYIGGDRLMFGTDYPYVDETRGYIDALPLERADKDAIMGGNAERLFKLKR
jgi:aminocarboxymuconate-semialdehyde decarboxylase